MSYHPFVKYSSENDYRQHFKQKYCRKPLLTFDGLSVVFFENNFDHAFYESQASSTERKSIFSRSRAERIDWIEAALSDPSAELYVGWDKKKKQSNTGRRLAVVDSNYVVVIQLTRSGRTRFITAFIADSVRTLLLIKSAEKWS